MPAVVVRCVGHCHKGRHFPCAVHIRNPPALPTAQAQRCPHNRGHVLRHWLADRGPLAFGTRRAPAFDRLCTIGLHFQSGEHTRRRMLRGTPASEGLPTGSISVSVGRMQMTRRVLSASTASPWHVEPVFRLHDILQRSVRSVPISEQPFRGTRDYRYPNRMAFSPNDRRVRLRLPQCRVRPVPRARAGVWMYGAEP